MTSLSWQRLLHGLEVLIIVTFLVALGLWVYEPTRDWVIHNLRLSEKPTEIALLAVVVNGAALLLLLHSVGRFRQKLDTTLTRLTETSGGLIQGGVTQVYNHLSDIYTKRLRKRRVFPHRQRLEVLGLTLFSAWQHLRPFLGNPDIRSLDIQLFCLEPDYIGVNKNIIPEHWKLDTENAINQIKDFVRNQSLSLQGQDLSIKLTTYSHFPGQHGFRIGGGSGDVVLSLIDWGPNDRILYPEAEHHFYEHISPLDKSARANLYRRMFDSWLSRASRTGQEIALP